MRRILQKLPSSLTRNILHSPSTLLYSNTRISLVPLLNRTTTSRFAFFSSNTNSALVPKINNVLSKEELKRRIESFLDDGDEDALPDLFEAMMNRKLSGKHDESDDEVMEEVRKYPINNARKVEDTENDGDVDSSDSDIESDDGLSDVASSDSDVESGDDGLSDGALINSDIESEHDGKSVRLVKRVPLENLDLTSDDSSHSDSESD